MPLIVPGGGGSVSSVNGQVGTVILDAADVGAATAFPSVANITDVYVDAFGSDSTGTGAPNAPWATLSYALSQITSNSSSHYYQINMGPGVFTEVSSFYLKPFCFVRGAGRNATQLDASFNNYTAPDGNSAGTKYYFGFSAIAIISSTDLRFATSSDTNTRCYFSLTDAVLSNNRIVSYSISYYDVQFGVNYLSCSAGSAYNSSFQGIVFESVSTFTFYNSSILGGSSSVNNDFALVNSSMRALSQSAGTTSIYIYSGFVDPPVISGSGAVNITYGGSAYGLCYTPTTLADWAGINPNSVQNALDRVATIISSGTGALLSSVRITGSSVINSANFTGIGGLNVIYSGTTIFVSGGGASSSSAPIYTNSRFTGSFSLNTAGPYRYIWSGNAFQTGILPSPNAVSGLEFIVKNISFTNTLTLSGLIDYQQNYSLNALQSVTLWSDNSSWLLI